MTSTAILGSLLVFMAGYKQSEQAQISMDMWLSNQCGRYEITIIDSNICLVYTLYGFLCVYLKIRYIRMNI